MVTGEPLVTVPIVVDTVIVDTVTGRTDFSIVRCNYLSVECDSPKIGWTIGIGGEELPFMMLGLVGIITRPFGAEHFNSTTLIEDLFKRIEDDAGLLINVDDIWLPVSLFDRISSAPKNGLVYRVRSRMFSLAFSFREGRLDRRSFVEQCERFDHALVYSELETGSFQEWTEQQMQFALQQYPKNKNFQLHLHQG